MSNLIFVSYSRADTAFVKCLIDDLLQKGLNIWLDQREIAAGQRWDSTIQEALQECETFIVVLSPNSVASENVQDEISYAINAKKRIIPILLRECEVPYRLARIQFMDFRQDYAQGIQLLYAEITHTPIQRPVKIKKRADAMTIATWIMGSCLAMGLCLTLSVGGYFAYKTSPYGRGQTLTPPSPTSSSQPPQPVTSTHTPVITPSHTPVTPSLTPVTPSITPSFTPSRTPVPQPPHAPAIVNSYGVQLYDEHQKLLTIKSGEQIKFSVMNDLWSGPEGSAPSCASGFLALTWVVRDPFPDGGNDLQLLRPIPMSERTEIFASGWKGSTTLEYCTDVYFFNNSLKTYRVEIRYASGMH